MIIKSRRCKDTWKATESCEDGSLVQSLRVSHTQLNVLNSIFSEISNRHWQIIQQITRWVCKIYFWIIFPRVNCHFRVKTDKMSNCLKRNYFLMRSTHAQITWAHPRVIWNILWRRQSKYRLSFICINKNSWLHH